MLGTSNACCPLLSIAYRVHSHQCTELHSSTNREMGMGQAAWLCSCWSCLLPIAVAQ
jgi:hypothetical protein